MEKNLLSLQYLNLRTGGITRHPCNTGVYLKSIIKERNDAVAFFPTTTCLSIFDDQEYYSEMKLNLFKKSHPDFERQRENLMKILRSLGVGEAYTVRMIHGTDEVAVVDDDGIYLLSDGNCVFSEKYDLRSESIQFKADAIITKRFNVALLAYSADCPTAFLRDIKTGAIGVLHSMWRGLVIEKEGHMTSIVEATVDGMIEAFETKPEDLEITIFPCIGTNQFVVDADVAEKFTARGLDDYIFRMEGGKYRIDLQGAMRELFIRCGVRSEAIEATKYTTADYGFNSYRMAQASYAGSPDITSVGSVDEIRSDGFGAEPKPYAEVEETKLRANASNFLIALRR